MMFSARVPDHAGTSGAPTDGTGGDTPASVGWGLGDHGLPGGGATAVAKNCDLKDESSSDETWQTG